MKSFDTVESGDATGNNFDDDGREKRTGTLVTASAHIITAVVGSGVLSLAWAIAQLGWVAGIVILVTFAVINYYTSTMLADCYRSDTGTRNCTYMDVVRAYLGGRKVQLCGLAQYGCFVGVTIGYTITASISLVAIGKANCFHDKGHGAKCSMPNYPFMAAFGIVEIILSQIPSFHKLSFLSIIATVMSFSYASIGIGLAMAVVASGKVGKTGVTGTVAGVDVTASDKIWKSFQATGDIAFSYAYSSILVEIQACILSSIDVLGVIIKIDTLRSSPPENKVMKKASLAGVSTTTFFYMLCGCIGYAAFGNKAPGDFLTEFFYEPYWLIDYANACIVLHLIAAYQVFAQPIFQFVENKCNKAWPESNFITIEHSMNIPFLGKCRVNFFRLVWRTAYVILTTVVAMIFPFFNSILGLIGAAAFWPLTVYFPVEMHISQRKIKKYSMRWIGLKLLVSVCLIVTLLAAIGFDAVHNPSAVESADANVDDDGREKRTGTLMTASAHIITAVIGSGVLSLAWAIAQLGWVAGTLILVTFAIVNYYTSTMLADCYRSDAGARNYTYMDVVRSYLGGRKVQLCGLAQYGCLVGITIGYTITASISLVAIWKATCFHKKGHGAKCSIPNYPFMAAFGVVEIFLSQLPNFHKLSFLSIIAAVMSFSYASIGIGLAIAVVASGKVGKTGVTGTVVGVDVTASDKIWKAFQATGDIAFSYSFSTILVEIQDTLRSSPPENKVMKKATLAGVSTTTVFYILCGCMGYAAFGNRAPGDFLTDFGFYEPYWLINFANACIVLHLIAAYQVFAQPIFQLVENKCNKAWPENNFINKEHSINIPFLGKWRINFFRLVWRTAYVILTTFVAVIFPFFNSILGLIGATAFWPLTVYFPVEMHISQRKVKKYSMKWNALKLLVLVCLIVSLLAAIGSIVGLINSKEFMYGPNPNFKGSRTPTPSIQQRGDTGSGNSGAAVMITKVIKLTRREEHEYDGHYNNQN
ncbi:hypothetical protein HID58_064459 [Brassica napus]|uniref:Amino acid transporter transmembrane domain-containing protein n=1 Tax=Brassica napus TaxID=3708 RepID=A0ABQ7ZA10_BRANA|nr:hypothetical protein HID58_064459 [Brassica napus]